MHFQQSLRKGTVSGLKVLLELAKVIIPAVMVVNVLEQTGVLAHLSRWLGPLMGLFGLPGESALVLVAGNFISFYSGVAALVALNLEPKQVAILSTMLMICHAAISETALVARAGARATVVLGARVVAMVVVGIAMNLVM